MPVTPADPYSLLQVASSSVCCQSLMHLLPSRSAHVISNATSVHVRKPGTAKKFKAEIVCEGKVRYNPGSHLGHCLAHMLACLCLWSIPDPSLPAKTETETGRGEG